jgi:hypothetical protein
MIGICIFASATHPQPLIKKRGTLQLSIGTDLTNLMQNDDFLMERGDQGLLKRNALKGEKGKRGRLEEGNRGRGKMDT